jgi:hypothetical protein
VFRFEERRKIELTKFDAQYVADQIKECEELLAQIGALIKTLAEEK